MSRRTLVAALAALAAVLAGAAPAAAQNDSSNTLERTISAVSGGAFETLANAPGERYVVRVPPGVRARARRARERRSLLYFGQLTDPQILDEVSPIRLDFLDQAGGDVKDA